MCVWVGCNHLLLLTWVDPFFPHIFFHFGLCVRRLGCMCPIHPPYYPFSPYNPTDKNTGKVCLHDIFYMHCFIFLSCFLCDGWFQDFIVFWYLININWYKWQASFLVLSPSNTVITYENVKFLVYLYLNKRTCIFFFNFKAMPFNLHTWQVFFFFLLDALPKHNMNIFRKQTFCLCANKGVSFRGWFIKCTLFLKISIRSV